MATLSGGAGWVSDAGTVLLVVVGLCTLLAVVVGRLPKDSRPAPGRDRGPGQVPPARSGPRPLPRPDLIAHGMAASRFDDRTIARVKKALQ